MGARSVTIHTVMSSTSRVRNSRTVNRGFRITHTQNNLLNTSPHKGRSGAIVRVLLSLYFNKRIPGVDALIKAEEEAVEAIQDSNLLKFRNMLKNQGQRKREEKNGTNSSSI